MEPLPPLDIEQLQAAIHAALSNWFRLGDGENDLARQLLLIRTARQDLLQENGPFAAREATNAVLEHAIDNLAQKNPNGAKVLRLRFIEGEITRQVAARMHASPDQVNRWQRSAIEHLTQIVYTQESLLRREVSDRVLAQLPSPSYTSFVGLQEVRHELVNQLLPPGEPRVVAISGIGGIGKTALADAVARDLARVLAFENVVWLRAESGQYGADPLEPAETWTLLAERLAERLALPSGTALDTGDQMIRLRQALRERPCLVVIDNLEDEALTVFVLARVRELVNSSKFLVTTRARPAVSAPAYFRSLEELPYEDARTLLLEHAQTIGTMALIEAHEDDIQAIYRITGGNPLALKLVAGLIAALPLEQVLLDLDHSRPGPIEDLYRAIYWDAWRALTPPGQALLQAMPLVAEVGAEPEQMQAISGLSDQAFWPAVRELFTRSLLEVRGSVNDRRYSVHRLTETFLRTEIIKWPEGGNAPGPLVST